MDRFDVEGISGKVRDLGPSVASDYVGLYINDVLVTKAHLTRSDDRSREFKFGGYDFWRFSKRSDKVSIRFEGAALPMPNGKLYAHPARDGKEDLESLEKRFSKGQAFDLSGRIRHLPKDQDHTWQEGVLTLYQAVAQEIESVTGCKSFLYSGTLLGYVRNNGFIPHDKDMDCAYLSMAGTAQDAAAELAELGEALIAAGFHVTPKASCISVRKTMGSKVMVDIAHLFIKPDGFVGFPFGTVGTEDVSPDAFVPTGTGTLSGYEVGLPARPKDVVEHIYGAEWGIPDPGFTWTDRRRRRDPEALLSYGQRSRIAMNDFYSRPVITEKSSFSKWLTEVGIIPEVATAIDVGCGNGRDSSSLLAIASSVVGVDRSDYAVTAARDAAGSFETLQIVHADILVPGTLSGLAKSCGDKEGGAILFYHRFVLNGLTSSEEKVLLSELAAATEPGDFLAFEHRTEEDKDRKKAIFRSFRRFVNSELTVASLEKLGFKILHNEAGVGMSQFGREDPHVVRIIAKRL